MALEGDEGRGVLLTDRIVEGILAGVWECAIGGSVDSQVEVLS